MGVDPQMTPRSYRTPDYFSATRALSNNAGDSTQTPTPLESPGSAFGLERKPGLVV